MFGGDNMNSVLATRSGRYIHQPGGYKAFIPKGLPPDPLLIFLGSDPLRLDDLVQASRLPASEVLTRLSILELQGLVRELSGKIYVLAF
jgi:predicted Rossmann fold nucleotide-binding protein DprA/Smf involved in DNA uptake